MKLGDLTIAQFVLLILPFWIWLVFLNCGRHQGVRQCKTTEAKNSQRIMPPRKSNTSNPRIIDIAPLPKAHGTLQHSTSKFEGFDRVRPPKPKAKED